MSERPDLPDSPILVACPTCDASLIDFVTEQHMLAHIVACGRPSRDWFEQDGPS